MTALRFPFFAVRYVLLLLLLGSLLVSACTATVPTDLTPGSPYIHSIWLVVLAGFSSSILFAIWKSQPGNEHVGWGRFWRVVCYEIGDEKSNQGILALALAIFCWLLSGLASFGEKSVFALCATGIFSSLNSCFLLLFLKHLDKEDLPHWHPSNIVNRLAIWYISIGFILAGLAFVFLAGNTSEMVLLPDLIFSVMTLLALGFDFFHLFSKRMGSKWIGLLAIVPVIVTLLAELMQYVYFKTGDTDGNKALFGAVKQTLFFSYKPLLIVSYFLLIYTWQEKRIKRGGMMSGITPDELLHNRKQEQYKTLGERDWLIVEALANGNNATKIADLYKDRFPNGADGVSDRVTAIAKAFNLQGEAQISIVMYALQHGLLAIENIELRMKKA